MGSAQASELDLISPLIFSLHAHTIHLTGKYRLSSSSFCVEQSFNFSTPPIAPTFAFKMAQLLEQEIKQRTLNFRDFPVRKLEEVDLRFLRIWLGEAHPLVTDSEALKAHILRTHHELRGSDTCHVYSCMSSLSYLCPRARLHPLWNDICLKAKAAGSSFQILDVGSCMGQETRALIVDGVEPSSITTSDVHEAYWQAGRRIFIDDGTRTDASYTVDGVTEIWGDWTTPLTNKFVADIKGKFDAVLCKNVHHALSEQQSEYFHARLVRVLKSGGVLFGTAVGRVSARLWARNPENTANRYLHDKDSLEQSLRRAGFDGEITVVAKETKDDFPDAVPDKQEKDPAYLSLMKDRRYLIFSATKL